MSKKKKRREGSHTKNPSAAGAATGCEITDAGGLYEKALLLAKRGRRKYASRVVALLQAAVDCGHAQAAHALATWYIHGIGVRRNFAHAIALEKIAARANIAPAIYNLAFAYESGRGVDKNTRKAFLLYRKGARLGDVDAMYEVGRCLFYGIGTKENKLTARRWIEKSESR